MKHSHGEAGLKSIDFLAYSSHLATVNPGIKMIFSVSLIIVCVATRNIPTSLFIAVLSMLTVTVLGGTSLKAYLSVLKIPMGFLIVGGVAIAIDFSGITLENAYNACRVMATAFGAVSAMFMLTLTTPVSEITDTLGKMHVPKLFVELMNMIYRFIFVMSSVQSQMTVSAKSRLGYCNFKTGLKTFGSTLGNLLVVSLSSANSYYDAMRARCYDGRLAFLNDKKPIRMPHVVFCVCCMLAAVSICVFTR